MDILTFGEALVEIMRTGVDQPLNRPGPFTGPYPSGAPFIFAVQAARLGAKVGAIGSVGVDAFGECLINQLEADFVDYSGVRRLSHKATGAAFISYNGDGTRDFVFNLGAGAELSPTMLHPGQFENVRCLHIMGSTLSLHDEARKTGLTAMQLARKNGVIVSFDPNLREELLPVEAAREAFRPFLEEADIILPTDEEIMLLMSASSVERAVGALRAMKPERVIVVTQGPQGCTVYTGRETTRVPGYPVRQVDPTGAGDCFDAGFLVQFLNGAAPDRAARFANACGALAVTEQGPMAGAFNLSEVRIFMESHR